jgi:hypothetical protein
MRFLLALLNHVTFDYFRQYDLWWGHYWSCARHDLAIWTPSKTKMAAFIAWISSKSTIFHAHIAIKGSFQVLSKLYCLFFFDLRILITPLVSSNSSQKTLLCNVSHTTTHNKLMLIRRFNTSSLGVKREKISHTRDLHLHPVLRSCCHFDTSKIANTRPFQWAIILRRETVSGQPSKFCLYISFKYHLFRLIFLFATNIWNMIEVAVLTHITSLTQPLFIEVYVPCQEGEAVMYLCVRGTKPERWSCHALMC